jgi:hypothetical protein
MESKRDEARALSDHESSAAFAPQGAYVSFMVPTTPDEGIDWDAVQGPALGRLSDALLAAFPTADALRQFLEFSLGQNLHAIAGSGALSTVVFDLLIAARAQGWLRDLYAAALAANPGNKKLAAFGRAASVLRATGDGLGRARLESVGGAALQSAVAGATPYQDIEAMILALSKIRGQVCRIEIGGRPAGTGFLIGPSTVLTNWHVVHDPGGRPVDGASVVLRFDYLRAGAAIVHQGTEFRLERAWLLDALPASAMERGLPGASALPSLDELDCAVLRVADEPGRSRVGGDKGLPGAPSRGWVRVPPGTPALSLKSPLSIVQHPLAEPLSVATGTSAIVAVNANRTRVTYAVHTEPGSSGAPCFDANWALVALHHSGQPAVRPAWNEGVPIDAIRDRLTARGCWTAIES